MATVGVKGLNRAFRQFNADELRLLFKALKYASLVTEETSIQFSVARDGSVRSVAHKRRLCCPQLWSAAATSGSKVEVDIPGVYTREFGQW